MHARSWRWKAEIHTHNAGTIDLSSAVISGTARKSLAEPAGTFSVTTKPTDRPGGKPVNLLGQVGDDDWIIVGATDSDGTDWIITTGLVDSVRRQRAGSAGATTQTVQGRDLGKVLLKTDLLDMPWLGTNLAQGLRNATEANFAINSIPPAEMTPSRIVAKLLEYCLSAAGYRGASQFWAVPETIVFRPDPAALPVSPAIRQASDVISTQHIAATSGLLPTTINIPVGIGSGGGLWAMLTQYANPLLNELYIDNIAEIGAERSATAFAVGSGGFSSAKPSLRLRPKPFPSLAGSSDWRALPVNEFPESDFESIDVGKSGAERFNWISIDSAIGAEVTQAGAKAMLEGATPASQFWDSVPAVFGQSIERHGLLRLHQATPYLSPAGGDNEVVTAKAWVRLLRDWYAPNPVFLSGTATISYLAPGVRIGERLRIRMRDGSVEEFYVEAVDHRFTKQPSGAAHGSTTLSITRGWRLPDVAADYASTVERWLRDNLEALT
jgi:hypothetical protein